MGDLLVKPGANMGPPSQIDMVMLPPLYSEKTEIPLLKSRRPSFHLRDVVEAYMISKRSGLDGSIHKALDTTDPRLTLDPDRHKWKEVEIEEKNLESLYKDVEGDEKSFLAAIEDYNKNAEGKYKVPINMKEVHSMDDVMKAIDEARENYDEKERKGFFGPIRKAFRGIGNNQSACSAWLSLLPEESQYFSIICGGLTLIIHAAGRIRKINDEIVSALVRIPKILNKSRRVLAINKASTNLRNYSSALYVAVLHVMGHILKFYQQRAFRRAAGALILQESFQKVLIDKMTAMDDCSEAIDAEAITCDMELGKSTNQIATQTKKIAEVVYGTTGAIKEQTDKISLDSNDIKESLKNLQGKFDRQSEQLRCQIEALNTIQGFFLENQGLRGAENSKENTPETTPQKQKATSPRDPNKERKMLLSRLSYEKGSPRIDLQANLRFAMSLSLEDQDRAVYMMQSSLVKSWLQATKSSALLVNGYDHDSRMRSPLSFVSAKLSNALRQAQKLGSASVESPIIDLHFFCGEHKNWEDSLDNGPAGIFNSLLAQLLTQYKEFDLSLIKHLKKLDSSDTKALGIVFGKLLAQLPSKTIVFCIIDGLSFYDDDERTDDCEELAKRLIRLTRLKGEGQCIFKLLLTVPVALQLSAVDALDEELEVLRIPERLAKGGGFTEMKWRFGAGREVANLVVSELSIDE